MNIIIKITLWLYSFLPDLIVETAAKGLYRLIYKRRTETRNRFQKQYPEYRKYKVDQTPPLLEPLKEEAIKDYKLLLQEYQSRIGKVLPAVKPRKNTAIVPDSVKCPVCGAPHNYIYYNDGQKRSQLKCKVCDHLFQINSSYKPSVQHRWHCPYCNHILYKWKVTDGYTIYKCGNDNCLHRLKAQSRLNREEHKKFESHSSQFKLCYQYREYHLKPEDIKTISPEPSRVSIHKIHNSLNVISLVLSFHVSFAMSARKTAMVLRDVFEIPISYQTVLNYAEAAAFHCHRFNLAHKGPVDTTSVGDETYIKIKGRNNYVWLFVSPSRRSITSYHISDNRGAIPAIISMAEAKRTIPDNSTVTFITDGNPSYTSACVYFNSQESDKPDIQHHKVIGLKNLDSESTLYRPYKQIMERANRTYKFHVKPAYGFDSSNGAVCLTTLFVTHYNYLRPHSFLGYETPVILPELTKIPTIQGKWAKILTRSFSSPPPFS